MLVEHIMIHGGVIRRLWPADLSAFRDHLLRLDAQSRFDRFAMAVNENFLMRYAERCFGFDDLIYGYYVDGVLRGTGEFALSATTSSVAPPRRRSASRRNGAAVASAPS